MRKIVLYEKKCYIKKLQNAIRKKVELGNCATQKKQHENSATCKKSNMKKVQNENSAT